ncbi:MAG TPA: hypothetical protein VFN31_00775 [Candidatus Saccharimonadales bacterium]|nr:hypothetical protein [Candidatus Saccharimonadales bacterium]
MNSTDQQHYNKGLTPSMLSIALTILGTLFILISAVLISLGKTGRLQNDLFALKYVRHGISDSYRNIATSLNSNHIISQLPLWIFWGSVGIVVYLFIINVVRAVTEFNSVKDSLHYVHANPREIFRQQIRHLLIRCAGVIILWLTAYLFFKYILPFFLSRVREVTMKLSVLNIAEMLGLVILLMVLGHLVTLAIRLTLLKPRVLGY